jgi:ribosomal protein S4E
MRLAWATSDAERYLSAEDGREIDVKKPTFVSRNDSMYVNIKDNEVISPSDVIGRDDAESIMHTVNVALERIFEVTEIWGHQIGTKGFMK